MVHALVARLCSNMVLGRASLRLEQESGQRRGENSRGLVTTQGLVPILSLVARTSLSDG